jgi:hypothetical protein
VEINEPEVVKIIAFWIDRGRPVGPLAFEAGQSLTRTSSVKQVTKVKHVTKPLDEHNEEDESSNAFDEDNEKDDSSND